MSQNRDVNDVDVSIPGTRTPQFQSNNDSGYFTLPAFSPGPLAFDADSFEQTTGVDAEPAFDLETHKQHELSGPRGQALTAPPLFNRPDIFSDVLSYDAFGHSHGSSLSWNTNLPAPLAQNFSLPNLPQHRATNGSSVQGVFGANEDSIFFDPGSQPDNVEWFLDPLGNAGESADAAIATAASELDREKARVFVKTWMSQFPNRFPSPEVFCSLATLSELEVKIIETIFCEILHGNAEKQVESPEEPRIKEILEPETSAQDPAHDAAESTALEQAAVWVAKQPVKKCLPIKNGSLASTAADTRIYKCSLGCSRTFNRKDVWKDHEERVYPQEGWICNLDTTVVIKGVLRCSYCALADPAMDHMAKAHPKLKISGSCHQKPLGRGKVFYRKEHLVTHFRNVHRDIPYADFLSRYHFVVNRELEWKCTLCSSYQFCDWSDRLAHLAYHYESDAKHTRSPNAIRNYTVGTETNAIISQDLKLRNGLTPDKIEAIYGLLGYFKAENILYFRPFEDAKESRLDFDNRIPIIVGDYGLSHFYHEGTRSRVEPGSIGCSRTYAPPEVALREHIDIWSMRCIFLEACIYNFGGSKGLAMLADAHGLLDPARNISDDDFHPILLPRLVFVKNNVLGWTREFHETFCFYVLFYAVLDLLLLMPDQRRRSVAKQMLKAVDTSVELYVLPSEILNSCSKKRSRCEDQDTDESELPANKRKVRHLP